MDSAISLRDDVTLEEVERAAWRARKAKEKELGRSIFLPDEEVVERAERIYNGRYKAEFESRYRGQVVAIDIESEQAFVGDTPGEAWMKGLRASLTATLFLFRVGYRTAFDLTPGGRDVGRKWFT